VTAPRRLAKRDGITPHFARLPFDEVTVHDGVPTTSVPRTLADLAATDPEIFTRALEQAEIKQLRDPLSLRDLLDRDPRRRGAKLIRKAIDHLDTRITKEELERRFRSFVDNSGLPRPQTNASIGPYEVDVLWPEARLVVELDSREHHFTTFAFERDRERDRTLATQGYLVIRVTWRQLHDDPDQLERDLHTLLAERSRR
jgi:very-short-patch-repair endonuclease